MEEAATATAQRAVVTAGDSAAAAASLEPGLPASAVLDPAPAAAERSRVVMARQSGFAGDPCDDCGQLMMVRNGTCLKCMNCGATSGCS